jgi:FAD/FMN-containing dehydrogenase
MLSALGAGLVLALPRAARAQSAIILDDASRMDATPVARHVVIHSTAKSDMVERLRRELKEAAAEGRAVAMGVARHSMGGQSLARDGTALTFATPTCEPDIGALLYRAEAGARWRDVIAKLDPLGFSPLVMQANNDFGLSGTLSVNAHGWPVPFAPFGSTVRGFRLMLADGTIVACSRSENTELFRHVMGGYGLFGVILDLDVAMTPNLMLMPSFERHAGNTFGARFPAVCTDPSVVMAYGRLDLSRDGFLDNALLIAFRPVPPPAGGLPSADAGGESVTFLSREIYRGEIGSDWAKRFRWFMESSVEPLLAAGVTRNRLLNEGAVLLAERSASRTDILHEYFVPPDRFADFLDACREVIPRSTQDLLNVTLRYLEADTESVLAYAPAQRISAVMSFSQARSSEGDAAMERMTRELIDRVLAIGGSFYLPYRLHARRDQVARAYPALRSFAAAKRRYDPGCLFRNALWDKWLDDTTRKKG